MRICLVSRYFDFRNAGIGRVGLEIKKQLEEKGHDIITIADPGRSLYSYFYYTGLKLPFILPKAHIYHAITPMESIWLPKDKSVVTFHDLFQITDKDKLGSGLGYSNWKRGIGCRWYRFACSQAIKCKKIVSVSNRTREDLNSYLGVPLKQVEVITSGIREDLDYILPKERSTIRVGYLGQLDRRKRVNLLIDSFRKSNLEKLLIGGTGIDEDYLKSIAVGDPRIKFLGFIPDNGLFAFYCYIDIFVFPTWLEGYGLPIVEAMACKKPVIILQDAKIPNEVRDRCIIVNNLDILCDREYLLARCSSIDIESNYRWAKNHNWSTTVDKYLEVYKEVLNV